MPVCPAQISQYLYRYRASDVRTYSMMQYLYLKVYIQSADEENSTAVKVSGGACYRARAHNYIVPNTIQSLLS